MACTSVTLEESDSPNSGDGPISSLSSRDKMILGGSVIGGVAILSSRSREKR